MYFPFLRGKQFELIALRELNGLAQNSQKISPIIEPVKKSFSTLSRTVEKLKNDEVNFTLIINPQVGELINDRKKIIEMLGKVIGNYSNFQIGIYSTSSKSLKSTLEDIENVEFDFKGFAFIHNAQIKELSIFDSYQELNSTEFNLINFSKTSRRYHRNFPADTRVTLDDFFINQKRNSDYLNNQDEPFSEEHLYYSDDGFVGFSDYLTVGESYADGGFLPYAVAIHLTYSDDDDCIRIRHFVSDSNDDNSDVGGKFSEALVKLITWIDNNNIPDTKGIKEFKSLHQSGHFPGLGVIKKLSIMHHIELVSSLLES